MSKLTEEVTIRVNNIVEHIDRATDELWEMEYPNFPKDHNLKNVLKASIALELQIKVQDNLMDTMIRSLS